MQTKLTNDSEGLLTWLNGRAAPIYVHHNGKKVLMYDPEDGISIEDSIEFFVKKHKINLIKEINI
jgi:hypothetical protein